MSRAAALRPLSKALSAGRNASRALAASAAGCTYISQKRNIVAAALMARMTVTPGRVFDSCDIGNVFEFIVGKAFLPSVGFRPMNWKYSFLPDFHGPSWLVFEGSRSSGDIAPRPGR